MSNASNFARPLRPLMTRRRDSVPIGLVRISRNREGIYGGLLGTFEHNIQNRERNEASVD